MSIASRTAYSTWTPHKPTLFDGHYLRNRLTLDIGVLGYIGIVQHKEHSPEVFSIPPGTPCIVCVQLPYSYGLFFWVRGPVLLQLLSDGAVKAVAVECWELSHLLNVLL